MKFEKVYSKRKPYGVPNITTYPDSLEVKMMKEWKMFYSINRRIDHTKKYESKR